MAHVAEVQKDGKLHASFAFDLLPPRMTFASTRGGEAGVSFTDAVIRGMPTDGGLFVPEVLRRPESAFANTSSLGVTELEFFAWRKLPYWELVMKVMRLFISKEEVSDAELREACQQSYQAADAEHSGPGLWRNSRIVPLHDLGDAGEGIRVMELFHGPTLAFKDCALQLLGNLFPILLRKKGIQSATVLGATSGDTGSAAVAGVHGKAGVNALILYPLGRVSRIQELQMLSFNCGAEGLEGAGEKEEDAQSVSLMSNSSLSSSNMIVDGSDLSASNSASTRPGEERDTESDASRSSRSHASSLSAASSVNVVQSCAIDGATFDDCQDIVKSVFADREFVKENNVLAVNSINVARVLAQMAYYLWTGFHILDEEDAAGDDTTSTILFSVPTGNFGDVLAGYWCKRFFPWLARGRSASSPLHFDFVIGSNSNDILTRFFESGEYQTTACAQTLSPSMDIQVSSNFERFLFDVVLEAQAKPETEAACARVRDLLGGLKASGSFKVTEAELGIAREHFYAHRATELECVDAIKSVFQATSGRGTSSEAPEPYILCPHSAVGYKALQKALAEERENRHSGKVFPVALATAHYGKFVSTLEDFFQGKPEHAELLSAMQRHLPPTLQGLARRESELTASRKVLPKTADDVRSLVQAVRAHTSNSTACSAQKPSSKLFLDDMGVLRRQLTEDFLDLDGLMRRQVTEFRQRVTVRVPATTANMGPGFDCLGMALDIWNEITVERSSVYSMKVEGEGASSIPTGEAENLICTGVKVAYEKMGKTPPMLRYKCKLRVPFSAGLGSSSAAIVAGIMAGLALEDFQLESLTEELLQLACTVEGHPDNVAPCIYGGMQLGYCVHQQWYTSGIQIPHGCVCVVLVPDHSTETAAARAVLPDTISQKDAIFNMSRVGLLINAFNTRDFKLLRWATEDAMHQKQRGSSVHHHLFPIMDAALGAGAHGCFLSGAGPSVLAICSGQRGDLFTQRSDARSEQAVAKAMLDAARKVFGACTKSRVLITRPVEYGAHIVAETSNLGKKSALADQESIRYM